MHDVGLSAVEAQAAETRKGRKLTRDGGGEWDWLVETFEPIKGDAEELKDARQVVEAMFGK
jgi:hypothetical protein